MLRRRSPLILGCLFVVAAVAFGFSELQQKEYSASASLLFRNPGFAEDLFGSNTSSSITDPTREAATNVKLVGLKVVGARAAKFLDGLSAEEVSDMVSVSSEGEADVVSVTATATDPNQAARVANTFARQFIAFRTMTEKAKLIQAKDLAEKELKRLSRSQREGARGQALSQGAEKLGILASLQTGNAELVQPAETPTSPSSPKPVRNTVLGAVLGLLFGIALAFLLERLDRRLRDADDAQAALGLPLLAAVGESKVINATNHGTGAADLPFAENEAFHMLRASLSYFNVDHEIRSVVVVSHSAGAGKSTVSWNLARVAARSARAIIVETDLRKPSLARQHGMPAGPGLAELLTHQVDLDRAIQVRPITDGKDVEGGTAALDVIVAGAIPPNPAELLASQAMSEVLSQLTERYDLVVIDTAPLGVVSDAFPLLRQVDGVVTVVSVGMSTRDGAEQLREQLDRLEAPTLGVVVNRIKPRRGGRYGYGGYGDEYVADKGEQKSATRDVEVERNA